MFNKKSLGLILILALVLIIGGCSSSDDSLSSDSGELALSISDAPVNNAKNVFVTLDKVEVHSQEQGWILINDFESDQYNNGELEVDLLDLRFDDQLLGQKSLPEGTYEQIRLYVATRDQDVNDPTTLGKSYVVYKDSSGQVQEDNIFIPSGVQSGLKIDHTFTIEQGTIKQLLLDNDVSKLLNQAGQSNKIMLRPTAIDIIDKQSSGNIEGIVKADTNNDGSNEAITKYDVVVEALDAEGNLIKSTVATTTETTEDKTRPAGSFKLRGLAEGNYQINAYAEDDSGTKIYKLEKTVEVNVTAANTNTKLFNSPLILSNTQN